MGQNVCLATRNRLLKEHLKKEHPEKTVKETKTLTRAQSTTAGWRRGFYLNASMGRKPEAAGHELETFVLPCKCPPSKRKFAMGTYKWTWERWWWCSKCLRAKIASHGTQAVQRSKAWTDNCETAWGKREFGVRHRLLESIEERTKTTAGDETVKKQLEGASRLLHNHPEKKSQQ